MKRWWPTVPEIADNVRHALAAGDDVHAIRMLMDGINALPAAQQAGSLDETLSEPDTIGDQRWDALLVNSATTGSTPTQQHSSATNRTPPRAK